MNKIINNYPLSEKKSDVLKTPNGLSWEAVDLQSVLEGKVQMKDLRITTEALEMQAQIADTSHRHQLAENLRRAAELVKVPETKILEVYQALRPGRSNEDELKTLAKEMENNYKAERCAKFLREAAKAYFS